MHLATGPFGHGNFEPTAGVWLTSANSYTQKLAKRDGDIESEAPRALLRAMQQPKILASAGTF